MPYDASVMNPAKAQKKQGTTPEKDLVWAVIPARYGSTRLPGKPLAMLAGKPMIQHVCQRAERVRSVAMVIVATDDERIKKAVEDFGGKAVLTGEHPTGTDRIAEAVRLFEREHAAPGWVLNVQGDEPLIDPHDLESLVSGLIAGGDAPMGTLVYPLRDEAEKANPNIVKAVLDSQGRALYFSRAPVPCVRDQNKDDTPNKTAGYKHLGIYLYRRDFLDVFHRLPPTALSELEQLEQLRALEHGYSIQCFVARSPGFGVDVPEDLARAEEMILAGKAP